MACRAWGQGRVCSFRALPPCPLQGSALLINLVFRHLMNEMYPNRNALPCKGQGVNAQNEHTPLNLRPLAKTVQLNMPSRRQKHFSILHTHYLLTIMI